MDRELGYGCSNEKIKYFASHFIIFADKIAEIDMHNSILDINGLKASKGN